MAKWASANMLDGGLNYLAANASAVVMVRNYTAGDSMATINANKVVEAALVPGDFAITSQGSSRKITSATKTANATSSTVAGDDLHFVFHNGSDPIYATDETTDQVITSGNPVQIPQLVYTSNQPT